jgi:predicted O-methyltransferase YrrM
MKLDVLEARLAKLDYAPLTSRFGGRMLYELVLGCRATKVLELGFAHGTSTAYIAAALEEVDGDLVTTIDRVSARSLTPNIDDVLHHLDLVRYAEPIFSESSYTWELMRLLERFTVDGTVVPAYDLCFVDGAHTWDVDGFAFFLVDKLLTEDSWIVFDDVHWTHHASPTRSTDALAEMPEDERTTAQISKVFDLLVRQHPAYDGHRIVGDYACAYKVGRGSGLHEHLLDTLMSSTLRRELAVAIAHQHEAARRPRS